LERLLPNLISIEQGTFVENRLIHDNIALTQEMTQNLHTNTRGGNVILNIDMEKAFDRLEWNFIYKVLTSFGFSNTWINLIKNCIEVIPISIIINGSSSSFFNSSRGLRQGDPMSPYLFILAEEVLSRGITNLLDQNKINPYFVTKSIKGISHSLYADDIIIFTNGNSKSLSNLMNFLLDYQQMSGQKINYFKSQFLASKHINNNRKIKIASITKFVEGKIPFLYLGCNIFYGKSRPIYFENIIQKFQEKLVGWKAKLISK
jgi:mannosylglycoprotein endo-beta-mannosidase